MEVAKSVYVMYTPGVRYAGKGYEMALKETTDRLPHFVMSLRVKPHIGQALEELSRRMSINKTAVIITALRDLAKREGVPFSDEPADGEKTR